MKEALEEHVAVSLWWAAYSWCAPLRENPVPTAADKCELILYYCVRNRKNSEDSKRIKRDFVIVLWIKYFPLWVTYYKVKIAMHVVIDNHTYCMYLWIWIGFVQHLKQSCNQSLVLLSSPFILYSLFNNFDDNTSSKRKNLDSIQMVSSTSALLTGDACRELSWLSLPPS